MQTLTSQYNLQELHNLILTAVDNAGNNGVLFISETAFFDNSNGTLFLTHFKEVDGKNYETSRKELDPYNLYLLFDLFENVVDEHLIRKDD